MKHNSFGSRNGTKLGSLPISPPNKHRVGPKSDPLRAQRGTITCKSGKREVLFYYQEGSTQHLSLRHVQARTSDSKY